MSHHIKTKRTDCDAYEYFSPNQKLTISEWNKLNDTNMNNNVQQNIQLVCVSNLS